MSFNETHLGSIHLSPNEKTMIRQAPTQAPEGYIRRAAAVQDSLRGMHVADDSRAPIIPNPCTTPFTRDTAHPHVCPVKIV